jgi:hypothetical protein
VPTVSLRAGAVTDPALVRVTEDAAVKNNAFPSRPGYASGAANMQTHLHVEAWVKNLDFGKHVWVDAHILDGDGAVLHAETLPLAYARPAGDGGDVFVLDGTLYQGAVATQGSVEPHPDARVVEYRLYGEMRAQVYTDGTPHRCYLYSDVVRTT